MKTGQGQKLTHLNRTNERVKLSHQAEVSTFGVQHGYKLNFHNISLGGAKVSGGTRVPFQVDTIVEVKIKNGGFVAEDKVLLAKVVHIFFNENEPNTKYYGIKFITDIEERKFLENIILSIKNNDLSMLAKTA